MILATAFGNISSCGNETHLQKFEVSNAHDNFNISVVLHAMIGDQKKVSIDLVWQMLNLIFISIEQECNFSNFIPYKF